MIDEETFECPKCHVVLKGDDANDHRVWIAQPCECSASLTKQAKGECANCGYDVCMDCEDDYDQGSVHSTCCMDCGKGFTFDEPVSAKDYYDNNHEQKCSECNEGTNDEE